MPEITIAREKQSHLIRNITIIIIIGLLIWQYGIPFIDANVKLPSEYINDVLNPNTDNCNWQVYIIDQVTGIETIYELTGLQQGAIFQMLEYHTYEIGIQVNELTGSILGTYRMNILVEPLYAGNVTPLSVQIPSYQFWFNNRIPIPTDIYFPNYERSDSITFNFISPEGTYLPYYSNDKASFMLGLDEAI